MGLHFFEFEGDLSLLLFLFLRLVFFSGLLKFSQVLLLIVYALLKLSLQVVEFSDFVGDPRFTVALIRALSDC